MLRPLKNAYFRIGIHTAQPGTLCYHIHNLARSFSGARRLRKPLAPGHDGDSLSYASDHIHYDIARARQTRRVDGLALVFFLGLGDYLMATPLLDALRARHPDLPFYAYASDTTDRVNSSLVASLLHADPVFDKVFTYRGRQETLLWKNYDFRDALKHVPENFLVLPVLYDTHPLVPHRVTSVMETFGLPAPWPVPPPRLYLQKMSAQAEALHDQISERASKRGAKGVVFCHFDARSSDYRYPEPSILVKGLINDGYFLVSLTPTGHDHESVLSIDVATITPNDTIALLAALKVSRLPLYILSVNSVMWPISAGLNIKNLGLHMFFDESIHQYFYPNIFVVSQHKYPRIPPNRLFLADHASYSEDIMKAGTRFTTYDPAFVLSCFRKFVDAF
jgi:ADP-heptose:LPS heptosyltransferase